MQNKPITQSSEPAEALLRRYKDFHQNLSLNTITLLSEIYTQDIEFVDPARHLHGSLGLKKYLRDLARNLRHYHLYYDETVISDPCAFLSWEMQFSHRKLRGGELITVRGMTHLKFTTKVYYQEECYDLGGLLYDHLPVLGALTGLLRRRLTA